MKALCKDLGYAIPEKLTAEQSTTEDDLPRPTSRFELVGPEGSDDELSEGQGTRVRRRAQAPSLSNRREIRT